MSLSMFLSLPMALSAQPVPSKPEQLPRAAADDEFRVTSEFPGGSGLIQAIDGDEQVVRIIPTQHRGRGWNCWWCIRVSGLKIGQTLTVDVQEGHSGRWSQPERATYSDGTTWKHSPPGRQLKNRTIYVLKPPGPTVTVAWGPPFLPADAQQLCRRLAQASPHAEEFTLCRTRGGRLVYALKVMEGKDHPDRFGVWINARQHAWESGSSWVAAGLARWLISDDPKAAALRRQAVVIVVPIMDLDSVAEGAGGKNQKPHDHNRDWGKRPHWRATAAAMKWISERDVQKQFDLYLDLHNPGWTARTPFYMVSQRARAQPQRARNLNWFLEDSRQEITGPLRFQGYVQETGPQYDPLWKSMSSNWAVTNTQAHVVGLTLETAWNTPHSTPEGYQTVGRQLGLAVQRYLQRNPRAPQTNALPQGQAE